MTHLPVTAGTSYLRDSRFLNANWSLSINKVLSNQRAEEDVRHLDHDATGDTINSLAEVLRVRLTLKSGFERIALVAPPWQGLTLKQ
jgi:hypothetical protein